MTSNITEALTNTASVGGSSENTMILLAVLGAFVCGMMPLVFMLRGILFPYLRSKGDGKVLLRVFLKKGGFIFKVGQIKDGYINYKIGKDEFVVTQVKEAIVKCLRNSWCDCQEADTAPFVHEKVWVDSIIKERKTGVLDKDGNPVIDEATGKYLYEDKQIEVPIARRFLGFDDSLLIKNALLLVAQKPKIPIGSAFGGFNFKIIFIVLIVLAGVMFFLNGGI